MILTKEEFQKEFGYNSLPAVHRLIREKKIKTQTDGMINTEADENREFCLKRREKIQKKGAKKAPKSEEKPAAKNQKPEIHLNLELDILSQKYEQAQKQYELIQGEELALQELKQEILQEGDRFCCHQAQRKALYSGFRQHQRRENL